MQELLPNQKTLLDIIHTEGQKIPRFIDTKNSIHANAFLVIQNIYEEITMLASPEFLSDSVLELMYWEIECYLRNIKDKVTYLKVQSYINKKIDRYLKLAVELECFESATNLRKFIYPNAN